MPLDKLLLFWQGKELTAAYDGRTLLDLSLHTGFSLTVRGGVPGSGLWAVRHVASQMVQACLPRTAMRPQRSLEPACTHLSSHS